MTRLLVILIAVCCLDSTVRGSYQNVKLIDRGYEGILVAINPETPEDPNIISSLQKIFTEASEVLWEATRHRAYFKNITILVPTTWTNGSYNTSGRYSYDKADVLVAENHPGYGDKPYTLQFGECGGHGEYIHLTSNYLLDDSQVDNYGPKAKVLAHEWAHLRWGVFDETATGRSPEYYYDGDNLESTRSPLALKGVNVQLRKTKDGEPPQVEECEIDPQTLLPPRGVCKFLPFEKQPLGVSASLMSHQYLKQVVHFGHDDSTDPMNVHNKEAPNEQNRLCNHRSTWDVISSSEDFLNSSSSPSPSMSDRIPQFNIVQPKESTNFVLVIDTSGSMGSQVNIITL